MTEPHAYAVEVLVNPDTSRECWRLDDESDQFPDLWEAEAERTAWINSGRPAEHVRVVSLSVVDPDIAQDTTVEELRTAVLNYLDHAWPASDIEQLHPALRPMSHRVNIMRALGIPT